MKKNILILFFSYIALNGNVSSMPNSPLNDNLYNSKNIIEDIHRLELDSETEYELSSQNELDSDLETYYELFSPNNLEEYLENNKEVNIIDTNTGTLSYVENNTMQTISDDKEKQIMPNFIPLDHYKTESTYNTNLDNNLTNHLINCFKETNSLSSNTEKPRKYMDLIPLNPPLNQQIPLPELFNKNTDSLIESTLHTKSLSSSTKRLREDEDMIPPAPRLKQKRTLLEPELSNEEINHIAESVQNMQYSLDPNLFSMFFNKNQFEHVPSFNQIDISHLSDINTSNENGYPSPKERYLSMENFTMNNAENSYHLVDETLEYQDLCSSPNKYDIELI